MYAGYTRGVRDRVRGGYEIGYEGGYEGIRMYTEVCIFSIRGSQYPGCEGIKI